MRGGSGGEDKYYYKAEERIRLSCCHPQSSGRQAMKCSGAGFGIPMTSFKGAPGCYSKAKQLGADTTMLHLMDTKSRIAGRPSSLA